MVYNLRNDDLMFQELDVLHSFFVEIYGTNYSVNNIILSLQPDCTDSFKKCRWHGLSVPCSQLFTRRRSYLGVCCCFNFQRPSVYQYQNADDSDEPMIWQPLLVKNSGIEMGLSVVIEQDLNDFALVPQSHTATRVLIHHSNDFPDEVSNSITEKLMNAGQEIHVSIQPRPVTGSSGMRGFSPKARGCFFEDEAKLFYKKYYNIRLNLQQQKIIKFHNFSFYTLSECLLKCKIDDIINSCRCYPFHVTKFYPSIPECQLSDILCLQKWTDKWENVEIPDQKKKTQIRFLQCPQCLPKCDTITYQVKSSWGFLNQRSVLKELGFNETNITGNDKNIRYSHLKVFYENAYVTEYEHSIVYTWDELLSEIFIKFS